MSARRRRPAPRGAAVGMCGPVDGGSDHRAPAATLAGVSDLVHPLLPRSVPLLTGGAGALQVGGVDSRDGLLVTSAHVVGRGSSRVRASFAACT